MDLDGAKVWVTRPAGQADRLCTLINNAGGEAIQFPVTAITVSEDTGQAVAALNDVAGFSPIIFISRNAVKFAFELVPDLAVRMGERPVFAVGGATREALEKNGVCGVHVCSDQGGSEGLLELEQLKGAALATADILIVRGSGGRDLLEKELRRRGAKVRYAEVYRRKLPDREPGAVAAFWRDNKPDMIVVTSVEGLHNLVELTGEDHRKALLETALVVISGRTGDAAVNLGFVHRPVVAAETSDEGLLKAVLKTAELQHNEHRS